MKMPLALESVAALVVVLVATGCGCTPTGEDGADCAAEPLANPKVEAEGAKPDGAGRLALAGEVKSFTPLEDGKAGTLVIGDATHGDVTLRWTLPAPLEVDLAIGASVKATYVRMQGFGGSATGLAIRDDAGPILLVDDGGYGNALMAADLAPLTVAQRDAGCRNRKNEPGSLNNFFLVVTAGEGDAATKVEKIHGETGDLEHGGATYRVLPIKSTARVDEKVWTDAPYEFKAFAIARRPAKGD